MPDLGAILTAMVTPFDAQERVDEEAAVNLMHHLADHGSDGLVVCGTTGEATTLTDDEHVAMIELAVREMGDRLSIIAGAGSNDTRHAVHLTERCTAAGADAILSVTPYYNKPNRRGIVRHYEEVAQATDKPVLLYNIPEPYGDRTCPPTCWPSSPRSSTSTGSSRPTTTSSQPIDGLDVYAGNDGTLARALDLGEPGGVLVASHVVGDEMRRMVDEPENRAEIDASLRDVYDTLFLTANPICTKAALNMLGVRVGGLRLPLVEASEDEAAAVRTMLERHGLLEVAAT